MATATAVPPAGQTAWSHRTIAAHLDERGLSVSPATVGRVLADAEVRPHRVRGWLRRADDPAFWTRAGEICRLYLDPPAGTVLVSIDEKTGIQAKTRRYPEIPLRPGRAARREFEYVRHGTVSVVARRTSPPARSSPGGPAGTPPRRSPPSWRCSTKRPTRPSTYI